MGLALHQLTEGSKSAIPGRNDRHAVSQAQHWNIQNRKRGGYAKKKSKFWIENTIG